MNAVPEKAQISRAEKARADGIEIHTPPISAEYLINHLWEVGPVSQSGMGPAPVSFQEIHAWLDLTGFDLQPWEVRLLRRLSADYLSQAKKAEKADCPSPWQGEVSRDVVAKKVKDQFGMLAQLGRKK